MIVYPRHLSEIYLSYRYRSEENFLSIGLLSINLCEKSNGLAMQQVRTLLKELWERMLTTLRKRTIGVVMQKQNVLYHLSHVYMGM